ncbi:polysaccharide deacetylase family protein [Desulfuribacillus alkaliarsenatis]|uniref:NodB homology domain-containing protein n=1 Tax=Desulfuribacillus alkaliarsenatis TaxID=766136 RepID=A0A1E5FZP6_9FIRM|nr:polysaccharide deacetylase family protein [Desulfuribacillus alkaliarsenatis]OEF96042.1 hypothetical protein BHF68_09875 [Desulfuribacillus alkaliarsenatis]
MYSSRPIKHTFIILLIMSLSLLILIGCQNSAGTPEQPDTSLDVENEDLSDDKFENGTDSNNNNNNEIAQPEITDEPALSDEQLRELKVNELGEVMVLMYHVIGDKEDEWERTADNFRNDLKVLYEEGYYLVTARDFVTGNMDVPAGKTPVILTFDDSTEGHFRFLINEQGEKIVDPDSAVGIIENFANENPGFGTAATFYVNYPLPFRQNDQPEWRKLKFEYLVDLGMEIGNHTYGHERLDRITDEEVQRTLARHVEATQNLLPGYSVDTFALTFGIRPVNRELSVQGSYNGIDYHHKGVFLVGSNPAPSPFSTEFKPEAIPRIRAASVPSDFFNQWIDYFRNNPERRYVSDGDMNTITIPEELKDSVNIEKFDDRTIRTY